MKEKEKGKRIGKKSDYIKIRHAAYEYIVVQGKSQKEAAALLGISEKTMSKWAADGGWLELRKSRQSSAGISIENLRQLIGLLSERRLSVEHRINDAIASGNTDEVISLRKEASGLSAEMAYQNKALANLDKEIIALGVYMDVFDSIFTALRAYDCDLFEKTIEFQTLHLRRKSIELG
jgi:transposase